MARTMYVAAAVLLMLGVANAQTIVGQGSSAQSPIGAGFGTLPGAPPTKYTGTSSVLGQSTLKNPNSGVDFALSDLSMQPCDSRIVNVPYIIGLMAVYAKTAARGGPTSGLRFSACVLDRIYKCAAKTWRDPVIVGLNPRLKTNAGAIKPISRSEPSGTTFTFTNFLGKGCPNWKYGSITLMSNAPALRPCFNTHSRQRGSSGVATAFAATGNAVAYVGAGFIGAAAVSVNLKANTPTGGFSTFKNPNTALLTSPSVLTNTVIGTPTCSRFFDITAVRVNAYPMAYLGFFLAWGTKAPRPNKPKLKTLCQVIVARSSTLAARRPEDFKALSASLVKIANTRCGLIRP